MLNFKFNLSGSSSNIVVQVQSHQPDCSFLSSLGQEKQPNNKRKTSLAGETSKSVPNFKYLCNVIK